MPALAGIGSVITYGSYKLHVPRRNGVIHLVYFNLAERARRTSRPWRYVNSHDLRDGLRDGFPVQSARIEKHVFVSLRCLHVIRIVELVRHVSGRTVEARMSHLQNQIRLHRNAHGLSRVRVLSAPEINVLNPFGRNLRVAVFVSLAVRVDGIYYTPYTSVTQRAFQGGQVGEYVFHARQAQRDMHGCGVRPIAA